MADFCVFASPSISLFTLNFSLPFDKNSSKTISPRTAVAAVVVSRVRVRVSVSEYTLSVAKNREHKRRANGNTPMPVCVRARTMNAHSPSRQRLPWTVRGVTSVAVVRLNLIYYVVIRVASVPFALENGNPIIWSVWKDLSLCTSQ